MKQLFKNWWASTLQKINAYLLAKSFKAAKAKAMQLYNERPGKIWIVLLHGDFVAIRKQDFRTTWRNNPKFKINTIEEWTKKAYEFKPHSQHLNTAAAQ